MTSKTDKNQAKRMRLNRYLWSISKTKFNQFCSHCTLHGTYYFSDNSRWWLRVVWLFIVCCSLGLCCFLSHMIWEKFIIDPTLTVVETTHYSTADIPFPAVVMCDPEAVYIPKTENITNLLLLRGFNQSQVAEFYESFTGVKSKNYTPATYVRKMHHLLDDLGFPIKKLLDIFKKPCEEILLDCYWRSRPHNCAEMFRPVYTVMGYCCQFDIRYFKRHASTETNFVAGVQTTEALDVMVSGTKISPDGNVSDGSIMMYVYDIKDSVTLIDSAIVLTPAAYFDINVYLWAIDSSSFVKALAMHARKCILDTDPGIGVSFYQGCLTRLILKKVVNECKCLPFDYTAKQLGVEDYPTCIWDRLICVYQEIEKTKGDLREIISLNECYQRCDYVQYETEVELVKNNRHSRYMLDTHSRVVVHFSETTCMKYRREVLYTWDQMLANLGGIFGLCLGGSIVSIMEIIWFILDLICTIIHEAFIRRRVQSKNETINEKYINKVFIINQTPPKEANKVVRKESNVKILNRPSKEIQYKFIN